MPDDLRAAVTALADEFARAAVQWQRLAGDYATGAYDAYDIAAQKLRGALKENPEERTRAAQAEAWEVGFETAAAHYSDVWPIPNADWGLNPYREDTASDAPQGTAERLPDPSEGDGPDEVSTGRKSTYYDTAEPEEPA